VPPIYQPEVAAGAIYWSAYHKKRELNAGFRTSVILWGNKFFPGFGDRYLGKNGYDSQFTEEPVQPDRAANLWHTVKGPFGAHGRFDTRSIPKAGFLWLATRLPGLSIAVFLIILIGGIVLLAMI